MDTNGQNLNHSQSYQQQHQQHHYLGHGGGYGVPSAYVGSGQFGHVEEVIESDELVSDDEEGDEEGGGQQSNVRGGGDEEDEDDEDDDESDEEYREYQRFISTIFQDDLSDMSGTDADEDEDYSPNDTGRLLRMGLDLDEEDTDDEYFNVTRKEVHDLVDASLQVLAKGTASSNKNALKTEGTNTSSILSGYNSTGGHSVQSASSNSTQVLPANNIYGSTDTHNESHALSKSSVAHCSGTPGSEVPARTTPISPSDRFERFEQLEQIQKRNRLISAVVSKMFAGENGDNLVVDDMPIHNIRKLVARQMCMSLQLMIQMLLLSENMSESDRQCSSHLMELSNLRSSALTKTYLITEQVETLKAFRSVSNHNQKEAHNNRNQNVSLTQKKPNVGQNSRCLYDVDEDDDDEDEDDELMEDLDFNNKRQYYQKHIGRTMTRNRAANDPTLTRTSSSIFNVQTLSRVHVLLQAIDAARKERDRIFNEYLTEKRFQQQKNGIILPSDVQSQAISHGGSGSGNRGYLTSMSPEDRTAIFHITAKRLQQQIAPAFCIRFWKCLLPTRDYPLTPEFVETVNPASLYGSTIFTPAEDDLLLRGIISVNNAEDKDTRSSGQWESRVKEKFLPSKEEQLLQYRQLQLSSGPDDTKFKRYRAFEIEKQRHQKWTLGEDKELLRGFQVFGSKWFMIKLYFLPNKSRHEIKQRWSYLLKDWEKKFQKNSLKSVVKSDGKLVKSMKQFLKSLDAGDQKKKGKNNKKEPSTSKMQPPDGVVSSIALPQYLVNGNPSQQFGHGLQAPALPFYPPQFSQNDQYNSSEQLQNPPNHLQALQAPYHLAGVNNQVPIHAIRQQRQDHTDDDKIVETEIMSDSDSDGEITRVAVSNASIESSEGASLSQSRTNHHVQRCYQPQSQSQQSRQATATHKQQQQYRQPPILYTCPPPHAIPPNGTAIYPRDMVPHMTTAIQPVTYFHSSQPQPHPRVMASHSIPPQSVPVATSRKKSSSTHPFPPDRTHPVSSQRKSHTDNVAPLDVLLSGKSNLSLLGKKRKKEDRQKNTKSSNNPEKHEPNVPVSVPLENKTVVSAATGVHTQEDNDHIADHSKPKKMRTVHFTNNDDDVKKGGDKDDEAKNGRGSLFDSVMLGANKR